MLAVLLDPDKTNAKTLDSLVDNSAFQDVDLLLVGGSLVTDGSMEECMRLIRSKTDKTCIIFPGGPNQIDEQADALLLLSLISGRNPDLLIGKHVESAGRLKASSLEIISTGYILLDGGRTTTVSYISNTVPIPQDKIGIAVSTAIAGTMLGNQVIYLDCGSGALLHAKPELVAEVKKNIDVPLIIGGGITTRQRQLKVYMRLAQMW